MHTKYQPKDFEKDVLKLWDKKFEASTTTDSPSFVMMMPPPNITGKLHMGHALNNTLQDSIARYKRMSGYNTLWLPGTDHASIATELKIVQQLQSQGLTKKDLTREQFLQKCFEWKDEYNGIIVNQLQKLGCSVDWTRLAFTMDDQCNRAVNDVFVDLYEQGLIYRGQRIINWCVDCKTALSDAEVEYQDNEGSIWHINYDIVGGGQITIATTRPETMLGDVAIVVNPKDRRYTDCVNKFAVVPLVGRVVPILQDEFVDVEFGTGAVKVTPAHDPNDFEIASRHSLQALKILDESGKVVGGTPYDGMDRLQARKQIVQDLQAQSRLKKVESHHNSRGHCYRCKSVVEPSLSLQWFVKMKQLAEPAIMAVQDGQVEFVPKSYTKIYMHWMQNIRDWCISRQLWWGHKIPAYHCKACKHVTVSATEVFHCKACNGQVEQDQDVLDTWFSSALWPFSTLGYPEDTVDLQKFYPGSLLVTSYDIIFFWVARMIFSGIHHMGKVPFKKVLIHGIARASDGKKMSKSLGNGIDPIDIIDNYGADTLRFYLLSGVALGSDIRYSEERLQKAQAFCNKVYNAAKFVQHNLKSLDQRKFDLQSVKLTLADEWILTKLDECTKSVQHNFDKFEVGRVADALYNFVWDDFCDWYIEVSKVQIAHDKFGAVAVLSCVFENILRLLHPIVPFVSEYCYQNIFSNEGSLLALQSFEPNQHIFKFQSDKFEYVRQLIVGVRALRVDNNIAQNKKIKLYLQGFETRLHDLQQCLPIVEKLAACDKVVVLAPSDPHPQNVFKWSLDLGNVYMELEKVDNSALLQKLSMDKQKADFELNLAKSKLDNPGFVSKAPPNMIQAERDKLQKYTQIVEKLQQQIDQLT